MTINLSNSGTSELFVIVKAAPQVSGKTGKRCVVPELMSTAIGCDFIRFHLEIWNQRKSSLGGIELGLLGDFLRMTEPPRVCRRLVGFSYSDIQQYWSLAGFLFIWSQQLGAYPASTVTVFPDWLTDDCTMVFHDGKASRWNALTFGSCTAVEKQSHPLVMRKGSSSCRRRKTRLLLMVINRWCRLNCIFPGRISGHFFGADIPFLWSLSNCFMSSNRLPCSASRRKPTAADRMSTITKEAIREMVGV